MSLSQATQADPSHQPTTVDALTREIREVLAELAPVTPAEHQLALLAVESFGSDVPLLRLGLPNGFEVLIEVDRGAPVVSLQTWVRAGSRMERPGKTGISHLFEHLMFGETENTPHGDFDRLLEEAGGETNAATFLDWTYYHQNLPKEALTLGLRLEAERFAKLVLRDPQVASEKEVVANERMQRVDDDVDGFASEVLYREAFQQHGYGIPTIGSMADILAFTPEDCSAFYRTYYAPNNMTLVLVGDVDLRAAARAIGAHFGPQKRAELPIEDVLPEPPQVAERRLTIDKPTPTFKIMLGYRSPAMGDFDYAPLVVLAEIMFGGRSCRVHKQLVHTMEIATDVRGWVGAFRDPALFDISLIAREGVLAEPLLEAFDLEIEKLKLEPPSQAELEKAQAKLELSAVQGLESVSGRAESIGFYESVLGSPAAYFEKLGQYRRVARSDLLRVARRYLVNSARTVVIVQPNGEDEAGDDDEEDEAEA